MLILACIALGAFLYRWRGGPPWLPAPRWLKLAPGWLLALSGLLKAPAYAIGWRLAKGARATVIGEWLTGAAMGLGVGVGLA